MAAHWLLLAGFLLSGAAALGYELVWAQLLGLIFGGESYGILAVLAGFFSGLALGAVSFHRYVRRCADPARVYLICECVIACYGIASPLLLGSLVRVVPEMLGPFVGDNQSFFALLINAGVATLVLLPATTCMGATTVALVEAWRRERAAIENRHTVAWLYSFNTLGAVSGIVVTTYLVLPRLGTTRTAMVLAGVCLGAAVLVWLWRKTTRVGRGLPADQPSSTPHDLPSEPYNDRPHTGLHVVLFFTGFAAIGLEYVGTYVLAQVLENTVYTFANILAVYLVGTAIGAWLYTRPAFKAIASEPDRWTPWMCYGLVLLVVYMGAVLGRAGSLFEWMAPMGSAYGNFLAAELVLAALVFLPPTVLMGALFSHLVGRFAESGVGLALASNTMGSALAPMYFGLVMIRSTGVTSAFYAAGLIYLLLFVTYRVVQRRSHRLTAAGVLCVLVLFGLTQSSLVLVRHPRGYKLIDQAQGLHGITSISERRYQIGIESGVTRLLQINQNFLMGGAHGYLEKRIGHLPILSARAAKEVLYLGVGTGITAGSATEYPEVERVIAVELVPEALKMLDWFSEFNNDIRTAPRVRLLAWDARRFLRANRGSYDVIVADLFHPSRDGAGFLYTREHFDAASARLNDGGLFVQWLALYQFQEHDLKTIIRTFLTVFPNAHSMVGNFGAEPAFGLFGWSPADDASMPSIDLVKVKRLLKPGSKRRAAIHGVEDFIAAYMLDADALRRYAGDGPINTDLNQRIVFDAPHALGTDDPAAPYRCLASLLPYRMPMPDRLTSINDPEQVMRLRERAAPHTTAIGHYLNAEVLNGFAGKGSLSEPALEAYLRAYQAEPGLALASRALIELAARHTDSALRIVDRMRAINPNDHGLVLAHHQISELSAPSDIRDVLLQYLQTR